MEINNDFTNSTILSEEAKSIRAINRDTVHRICSGQVVLNLSIAVKELVENAIDAGATNIEVRLREYGSEVIEVSDNGTGVEECNFEALTLKHFTSKLQQFTDLESISTLGFRGEALSSLCALSNLTITTRHKSAEYAMKIVYDHNGHITSKTPCTRQNGTTVTLAELFSSLPVRRKEFIKNLKREFSKMCQLLYAYCIISQSVRIVCSHQTKKGVRTTIIATQGNNNIRENILAVFGAKQLESSIEIKFHEPDEGILEDFSLKNVSSENINFIFNGFISKCSHGSGRSTADRQFYFINSRPCEPTKVMKLVNEVYKYFNGNQYPFVILNIKVDQSKVDVNVTPDKRQIFLEQEKLLLATLKTSLLEMFKDFPCTLKMQNLTAPVAKKTEEEKKSVAEVLKKWSMSNEKAVRQNENYNRGVKRNSENTNKPKGVIGYIYEKRIKIAENFSQELSENSSSEDEEKQVEKFVKESYNSSDSEPELTPVKNKTNVDKELKTSLKNLKKEMASYKITIEDQIQTKTCEQDESDIIEATQENICYPYKITIEDQSQTTINDNKQQNLNESTDIIEATQETVGCAYKITTIESPKPKLRNISPSTKNKIRTETKKDTPTRSETIDKTTYNVTVIESPKVSIENNKPKIESENKQKLNNDLTIITDTVDTTMSNEFVSKSNVTVDINLDDIESLIRKIQVNEQKEKKPIVVNFRSEITSKSAEEELERHISKDMFENMDIIGQFNKGFIITKYNSDLFIVDQHASDEKYNFETLQKTTVLQSQKLVNPKPLDLTAANELLLLDNIEIFKKNGFTFNIDENAALGKKVCLTTIPVSKNVEFGKEDIDELLFMLQEDCSLNNCRPSRVRAMFASRACRKSVMIGDDLSKSDMRRLIDHMGQIEQPWNCPHGRPTMRHLINLDLIGSDKNNS